MGLKYWIVMNLVKSLWQSAPYLHPVIEVKDLLPHGEWLPYLDREFGWSQRTAYNFMNVAEKFATVASLPDITPKALYLLASPSTPESTRDEAIEKAGLKTVLPVKRK